MVKRSHFLSFLIAILFLIGADYSIQAQTPAPTGTPTPTLAPVMTPTALPTPEMAPPLNGNIIFPAFLVFLSTVLSACAWPIGFIVVVFILKEPVKKIMLSLKRFQYKDFEFSFTEELGRVEEDVKEAQSTQQAGGADSQTTSKNTDSSASDQFQRDKQKLMNLASVDPSSAVTKAWLLVEYETDKLAENRDTSEKTTGGYFRTLHMLMDTKVIPLSLYDAISKLRKLRNKAAHELGYEMSYSAAVDYINLSIEVASTLRSLYQSEG